ncbi:MAG: hypothetical protein AAGL11_08960 [Pseudomonadota bacterium]
MVGRSKLKAQASKIGICIAVGIAAAGGITTAHSETLTVYNDATGDAYIQLEDTRGIGDQILWNSDMQTEDGTAIGTGSGHCTQLDSDQNYFCSFVINLTGRGIIAGQGVQLTEPLESTFAITGGTGEFVGITGQMTSTPVENRARFVYEIDYH